MQPKSLSQPEILKSLVNPNQPQETDYIEYQTNKEKNSDITVSGINLVYKSNNPTQEWNKKIEAEGIKSLTLIGDTITIASPLYLPQTNIFIFARTLIFEDTDPQEPSKIDTSAKDQYDGITADKDGNPGANAGNITLAIEELILPQQKNRPRFLMNGSAGQNPSKGKDGTDGEPADFYGKNLTVLKAASLAAIAMWLFSMLKSGKIKNLKNTPANLDRLAKGIVYFKSTEVKGGKSKSKNIFGGKDNKPTDGTDAIPGGKPGNGGKGGDLTSNLLVAPSLVENKGGLPGKPNPIYKGGKAGLPNKWVQIEQKTTIKIRPSISFGPSVHQPSSTEKSVEVKAIASGETKPGKDAPLLFGNKGAKGKIVSSEALWLSEEVIQNKLQMLQDAYLGGRVELAKQIAEECLLDLDNANLDFESHSELAIYYQQFIKYYLQLSNNLDYFGNQPGWVPLLSFEAIKDLYQEEIDRSVELLLLSYVLEKRWANITKLEQSLQDLKQIDREMIEYHQAEIRSLQTNISDLDRESVSLEKETESYLERLKQKEAKIEKKFSRDEAERQFRKNLFNALTLASQTFAFSGLKTALIAAPSAALFSYLGGALEEVPAPASETNTKLLDNLSKQNEINRAKIRLAELHLNDATNSNEFISQIEKLSKIISEETRQRVTSQLKQEIGSETEAKLARIKQEDSEFAELFDSLIELIIRKQIFYDKALESVGLINSHLDEIASHRLSIEEINQSLHDEDNLIKASTRRMLKATREKAKERLIRYKYYMNKAYEHRLLEPVTSKYDVDNLFNELVRNFGFDETKSTLINIESKHYERLKEIYYKDLNELKSKIIDTFANNHTAPRVKPRKLSLGDDELKQLNSQGVVEIDLNQHIMSDSDRGAKITKIQVDEQNTKITNDLKASNSQIDVIFQRAGFSIVRWEDKDYYFEYGGKNVRVSPDIGGFSWSSMSGGEFNPHDSIDNDLLNNISDSKRIYTQPGARTKLTIFREYIGNSAPVDIQSLVLNVDLEAFSKRF